VDEGAGALHFKLVGEEAVGDLGEEELDGGVVFEEGKGDVGGVGEDGVAVTGVGPAEVSVIGCAVFAAVTAGGDGAAAGFLFGGGGFGGVGFGEIGHSFSWRQGTGNSEQEKLVPGVKESASHPVAKSCDRDGAPGVRHGSLFGQRKRPPFGRPLSVFTLYF
jgi:hypothetical protein